MSYSRLPPQTPKAATVGGYQPMITFWDALIVSLLVAGIIGSALSVAYEVHLSRQQFKVLQKSRQTRDQLDVEWGRLLIEQQTFGATSQIGSRAVIYLHMFSPPAAQTLTLTSSNAAPPAYTAPTGPAPADVEAPAPDFPVTSPETAPAISPAASGVTP